MEILRWYRRKAKVAWLDMSDAVRARAVVGISPVVVSLTTHGSRLATVHTSIQSIVAGKVRPRRLILWLNGNESSQVLSTALKRLQSRGLEIRYAPNFGPHTKYYPYVSQFLGEQLPLVTADDDVIYPKDWLQGLIVAHQAEPEFIHCYWARVFAIKDGLVQPYLAWKDVSSRVPSLRHAALGVAGVIYPAKFQQILRDAGDAFREKCARNDDVWLHAMAVRNGYRTRQVRASHIHPPIVPGTQDVGLFHANHLPDGYDAHIAATYSSSDLDSLTKEVP